MKTILRYLVIKYSNQKEKLYNFKFHFLMWLNNVDASGVHVSKGCPMVDIQDGAQIIFGKNVWFNNYHNTGWYTKSNITVKKNGILKIDEGTGLNGVLLYCCKSIEIGKRVKIGGGTRIYDTDFHPTDWRVRYGSKNPTDTKVAPIVIEDDVFIGTDCIIGKGRHIGARSIIAAGSVVVKDIPADCIAGGNPCKIIRMLDNETKK